MLWRYLLSIFIGLLLCRMSWVSAAEQKDGLRECLLISDIHFDPFADPSLFESLAKQPVSEWNRLLAASSEAGVSQLGSDSNYVLLESSLRAAAETCPRPDFVLYPGDSLAHDWRARYEKASSRSSRDDEEAYREFTRKSIQFLALKFRQHFPSVPVFPALGNEDAFCGDYQIEPEGEFLTMFADAWLSWLGPDVNSESLRASFARGGHYSVRNPSLPIHRIVVVNSVFFSNLYENACGSETQNPGGDEMSWLANVLAEASNAGERVWLLMHIPVGINDYNTVKDEEAGSPPVEFWKPAYTRQFLDVMLKHRKNVQVVFAGHTHMDDFRIVGTNERPLVVNKLVPSVSPIFRNNPAFQVYRFEGSTGAISSYETYYLANLVTAERPTRLQDLQWLPEYEFRSAYGQERLDISAVSSIARGLQTNSSIRDTYMRFYSVSAPPQFDKAMLPAYSCAILHTTLEEFEKCQKTGDAAPAAPPRPNETNEQNRSKSPPGGADGWGRQRSPGQRTVWQRVVSGP
jgi:sphingomyelin phosphodiesterase acid-like 3